MNSIFLLLPLVFLGIALLSLFGQLTDTKQQFKQILAIMKGVAKSYAAEGGQYE